MLMIHPFPLGISQYLLHYVIVILKKQIVLPLFAKCLNQTYRLNMCHLH